MQQALPSTSVLLSRAYQYITSDLWVPHTQHCMTGAASLQQALPLIPASRGSCVDMTLQMDRELKVKISEICSLLDVDGIRGDITTNKAARALAAYQGETTVTLEHVKAVIGLCLNHRFALILHILACGCHGSSCCGPSTPCSYLLSPLGSQR